MFLLLWHQIMDTWHGHQDGCNIEGCFWSWLLSFCPCDTLNPVSDQHLISPNNNTSASFIKIMRIKEMITNLRSFDCSTNSPSQQQRTCLANSMENMHSDIRVTVLRVDTFIFDCIIMAISFKGHLLILLHTLVFWSHMTE